MDEGTPTPTVTRDVDLEATPDEVWQLLIDDDERAGWLGVDPSDHEVQVVTVEEGRRLSFDWSTDRGDESHVEFVVTPLREGTRLTVTETFPCLPLPGRSGRVSATEPQCGIGLRRSMDAIDTTTITGRLIDLELRMLARVTVHA